MVCIFMLGKRFSTACSNPSLRTKKLDSFVLGMICIWAMYTPYLLHHGTDCRPRLKGKDSKATVGVRN